MAEKDITMRMYGAEINRMPRRQVLIRANMRVGDRQTEVCIRDLSARGMLVQASAPPRRGTFVEIDSDDWPVAGQVIWTSERRFGVLTRQTLDVDRFVDRLSALDARWNGGTPSKIRPGAGPRASHDRSRRTSHNLQFASAVVAGGAFAFGIAWALHDHLTHAFVGAASQL